MRKLFSVILLIGVLSLSWRAHADGWEYCRYSKQLTSDSWEVHLKEAWGDPGPIPPASIPTEYRIGSMSVGVLTRNPWTSFYGWDMVVGYAGMGGGVAIVEVRIPGLSLPSQPPHNMPSIP